ncbi:MAG: hypothetical protein WKF59_03585 [Chitinophagaceae bacterium]
MGEVIVTALGINKSKRSLGYAANDVKGEEISPIHKEIILLMD